MVDWFGRWTEEEDYNTYPKEKWCMYDYIANAIRNENYSVKTTMENLVTMILLHAECNIECGEKIDMEDPDDIMRWVNKSGGLREFDYEC